MNFLSKLEQIIEKNNSLLCIGLDPEIEKLPQSVKSSDDPLFAFNKAIIDATADLVCAFKPNIAFYEAEGIKGLESLKKTIEYLQKSYADIPIVLDAKRGDIGNTAKMYAKAAYDYFKADAVTVFPHLGKDSLLPFFEYKEKLTIALIKTSNPDSGMFQDLPVDGKPYYIKVAEELKAWNIENLGIFVGATYPEELKKVRELFPETIFLSAGFGAQEAEIGEAVKAGIDRNKSGIMFNASRSILYASSNEDFAKRAKEKAKETRDTINKYRNE